MDRFSIADTTLITVGGDAASVIGTSAELHEGDTLTIWYLLYGLMLPSWNDAAHQLAEYFGGILKKESDEREVVRLKELKDKQREEEEKRIADLAYKQQMEAAAAAVLAAAKLSN